MDTCCRWIVTLVLLFAACAESRAASGATPTTFDISFPASVNPGPITGRLLLIISRQSDPEVRLQVGWVNSPPMFGIDVAQLNPGQAVTIDAVVPGYPVPTLSELPSGDYYVQAVLNVYTRFSRSDGHVIWAHMDQWEGQQFNQSPGNLFSRALRLHLDPLHGQKIRLSLTEVIPPVQVPADTQWVKHIKIQSKMLTRFWGHPIYLGAGVLLPKDYDSRTNLHYPVIYQQGHFSHQPPFNFNSEDSNESAEEREWRKNTGVENGYRFYRAWTSDNFPRVIAITLLHPTPYYDTSYAVNSANTGPYGNAIMNELIPYIEAHFRIIRQPYARLLTGGSAGGWESLALQLFHPDFFGGTWTLYPDPVDFRRYSLVNIYRDDNSFSSDSSDGPVWSRHSWFPTERAIARADDGQPVATVRQASQLENVLGSKGRSGGFVENWEAVYGPVGDDGYPQPLWDKSTGKIDHTVANYMRDHGYDLRYYTQTNWSRIGPALRGKIHLFCGDMDNFYLNLGVYLFEDFLRNSRNPYYDGSFEYGRPLKGHGWQRMSNAELIKTMATKVAVSAPVDANLAWQSPRH
jgi:hypothetical protein